MGAASLIVLGKANSGSKHASQNPKLATEASGDEFRSTLRPISVVMRLARVLWPVKTASELALRTRVTQRQAEHWLAGKYDLSADALAELLRSDVGLKILEEIIGPTRPLWWKDFRRSVGRAELRRRHEEIAKQIERLENDE